MKKLATILAFAMILTMLAACGGTPAPSSTCLLYTSGAQTGEGRSGHRRHRPQAGTAGGGGFLHELSLRLPDPCHQKGEGRPI